MRTLVAVLLLLPGCAQLVVFDQAVIGVPDVIPGEQNAGLCDSQIQMGQRALCTESCEIDPSVGQTSCSDRVALDGGRGVIDVAGLHEVEVTVTACRREGELFRMVGDNGASVRLEGRSLHVVAAEQAGAQPFEDRAFFDDDDPCEDRTMLLQTGRIALTDTGRRLCSDHLVPVSGEWAITLSPRAVRSVELCFREPPIEAVEPAEESVAAIRRASAAERRRRTRTRF